MDLACYAVDAHLIEGRSLRSVAGSVGRSKSWVGDQVQRFREGGYEALEPRSRRPKSSPNQTSPEIEDEIVEIRKQLSEEGYDAGALTIRYHLLRRHSEAPSRTTIHDVLSRRGFITPQPQKRPRSSWIRFAASLPNECWQSDMTHWQTEGDHVEIISFIDDCSRMVLAAVAVPVATAADVVAVFYEAASQWGFPASVLTDNGCIYTAQFRGGRCGFETELATLGIVSKHGKPYHPQTQGKVERWHSILKRRLRKQPAACSIAELQGQLDEAVRYYNEERPHAEHDGAVPRQIWESRDKATPQSDYGLTPQTRVRHDKVDKTGVFTLRHGTKLHHIGIGRAHKGRRIIVLVADLDIRVLSVEGELLRHLTLDPSKDYQPIT